MHIAGLEPPPRLLRDAAVDEIDEAVVLTAGGHTDLFVDPRERQVVATAPALVWAAQPPFTLQARVSVDMRETFDAGALLLLGADDRTWVKLAVERDPGARTTIVTVVTRDVSDDCNHGPVEGAGWWLRATGLGDDAYALHTSSDGRAWDLVRYFRLAGVTEVGLSVQSPMGEGCSARFDELRWDRGAVADIRDGT